MARARRVASLPETLFWDLTPGEVDTIIHEALEEWRAKERAAAHNTAMVCACLYNCHRDPKHHPEPFTPDDFLPRTVVAPAPEPSDDQVAMKAQSAMRLLQALNQ